MRRHQQRICIGALAPSRDRRRRRCGVLVEMLDQELTHGVIFGLHGRRGAERGVGADRFGEVRELDLAGVAEGDGDAQRLLELADVEGQA